jgi:hypothetical protein
MKSSLDKLHIELYSLDGAFQGYAKHISESKNRVESTNIKEDALSYSALQTANKAAEKISKITNGCLRCSIG